MTPHQKKIKNALEREYLFDLYKRKVKVPCPRCHARPTFPCIHDSGPRRGTPMAGNNVHGERAALANERGLVKGPRYWRHRRS